MTQRGAGSPAPLFSALEDPMALKHYNGVAMPGRMAGVLGWRSGHYFTASVQEQTDIESHPWFQMGLILLVDDTKPKEEEERSTPVDLPDWKTYIESLNWNALRKLAKDRGVFLHGKKAVHLIEELIEMGE